MSDETLAMVIQILVPVLATALGTVLIALANNVSVYVKQRTKSNVLNRYIDILEGVVVDVVMGLNQTTVQALKDAAADGKLTQEEMNIISAQALDSVKQIIGVKGLEILKLAFEDVDSLIVNKLEHAVLISNNITKEAVQCQLKLTEDS